MSIRTRTRSLRSFFTPMIAAVLMTSAVACGGATADIDNGQEAHPAASREPAPAPSDPTAAIPAPAAPQPSSPDPSPRDPSPATPHADASGSLPASDLPTGGSCAVRTGQVGIVGSGNLCQVTTETRTPDGFIHFASTRGDRGNAALEDGTLVLRCGTGAGALMEIAVRCLQGNGNYEVAPGDLRLGGKPSDRTCRITVDVADGARVRGFISCPNDPADPENVFANSGAPIGLGAFDLPRVK